MDMDNPFQNKTGIAADSLLHLFQKCKKSVSKGLVCFRAIWFFENKKSNLAEPMQTKWHFVFFFWFLFCIGGLPYFVKYFFSFPNIMAMQEYEARDFLFCD